MNDQLAMIEHRLDGQSVARRLIASLGFEPRAIELCVYQPGRGFTPERPALPFQFAIDRIEDGGARGLVLRANAVVSNERNPLLPMPSSSFELALALPPAEAKDLYYRDPVANAQQAAADAPPAWLALGPTSPPHPAVRAEVARIFMVPGATTPAGQAQVTYTCRVIGHRLARRNDRYAEPGSGTWTLLRLAEPGDGWAALDLTNGWGELFPAGLDEATTICGQHLAQAIA